MRAGLEVTVSRRPNILFLLSDQHSPHICGWEGNGTIRTPSLDRLAVQGAAFRNAYCQSPLCVPSRASLLTGRYCRDLGIYDNQHVLESNGVTLPRLLGRAGYRTCLIGKAHFNGEQFQGYAQRPYGDLFGQAHQPDPRRAKTANGCGLGGVGQAGPSGIPLPLTQTEICVAEATKWLQAHVGMHAEQPFSLSVHFDKPHFPINAPARFCDHYRGAVAPPDVPPEHLDRQVPFVREAFTRTGLWGRFDKEVQRRALEAYYGCVEWVDNAIGRILQVLDYLDLAEETLVVYSSDHGEMAGEHGVWQKTVFFEASARVPLIVRFPGVVSAGAVHEDIVGLIDLLPTLCDAAGADVPEECGGVSLMPVLRGAGGPDRDGIFSESVTLKGPEHAGCMLRTGPWKYNYYLDGGQELYHLGDDPGELTNLVDAPEHHGLVADLRGRVEAFWRPDEQRARYDRTPRMPREKHYYFYSNQFMLGDGTVVDARP